MMISSALYRLIIYPIEIFIEVIYTIMYRLAGSHGIAIIAVSLVVSTLVLPLYYQADIIQRQERDKQKKMARMVAHIKKTFSGDEQFMILSEYYNQEGYKPYYSLRTSISLLLQIPFFIAAYHFLSNLSVLREAGFWIIKDLSKPDQLIRLGSMSLNLLPILMTAINILSSIIYLKDAARKEKIQLYGMALIFLVLLYGSPSGLVLYWTMNNVYSLVKNIIAAIPFRKATQSSTKAVASNDSPKMRSGRALLFFAGALLLFLLLGLLIPSSIVENSPAEFIDIDNFSDPCQYIWSTALVAAGFFGIWIPIFYYLAGNKGRTAISAIAGITSAGCLINYMFFGRKLGNLSAELVFDKAPAYSTRELLLNSLVLFALLLIGIIIIKKNKPFLARIELIVAAVVLVLSIRNVNSIGKAVSSLDYIKHMDDGEDSSVIHLSRTGKNVIVMMLDRAVGAYLPFIMNEMPALREELDGFTFYPNTVSFGSSTIYGSAPLFGGYEYTPYQFNLRKDEPLASKQNEALKVMPVMFLQQGYETGVADLPYTDYKWISDLSIFNDYPDIRTYHLNGKFTAKDYKSEIFNRNEDRRKRSFFCYSVFKAAPVAIQSKLYDSGYYYAMLDQRDAADIAMLDSYSTLDNLIEITEIKDTEKNTFFAIDNDLPHSPAQMQLPDYTVAFPVNNTGMETGFREDADGRRMELDPMYHYHVNAASFNLLARWLDYLREESVYDNTRIIIVADHGAALNQFPEMVLDDGFDIESVNPLLMVKDFDSHGFNTDNTFMTNADVPYLASSGLIDDPRNPFTGKAIDNTAKADHKVQLIFNPKAKNSIDNNNGYTFNSDGLYWYGVHDNLFDLNNWSHEEID